LGLRCVGEFFFGRDLGGWRGGREGGCGGGGGSVITVRRNDQTKLRRWTDSEGS